jgi:hypothetical protein
MLADPNDFGDVEARYFRIGEDFDPSLGFVARTGEVFYGAITATPRPENPPVRLYSIGGSYFVSSPIDEPWESYNGVFTPLDVLFESGDRIAGAAEFQGERPEDEFDVFDSPEETVTLLAGKYTWTRYSLTGTLAPQRKFSGEVSYAWGGFYDGDLQTVSADVFLKPHPVIQFQFTGERNKAQLEEGDFTQYLYGLRSELKPSPEFQISNFVQYDNESRSLGSSSRLRWTFHPQGDLFVTFNQDLVRSFGEPEESWIFLTDGLAVKLQYSFRR